MAFSWEEERGVPRRVKLFWNGELIKRVSRTIVGEAELRSLETNSLQKIFELEVKGGIRYALLLLGKRAMHSAQLAASLKRHYLSKEAIDDVIAYCVQRGYITDEEWVERRVSSWVSSGRSRQEIASRLRKVGVSGSLPHVDEQQALSMVILRKYPDLLDPLCSYEKKGKAMRALLRRGFSFESIQNFLQNK
jgi:SOS response regulatory protein OraA/RecX